MSAFRRKVFAWFGQHRRDLPWRRTEDPWRIMVSEVMLPQTQVDRVRERYAAFLRKWPTVRGFADASLADVLRFWSGLGYNRRAKHLHAAAGEIVRSHDGRVPVNIADLRSLPGVGPYTAAAVASFSRNEDAVVCDTNIRRVFLRYFHGGEFAKDLPPPSDVERLLAAALPKGRSRDWHSALMDLGSAVCTGRRPACGTCPLAASCAAAPGFLAGQMPTGRRLVRPQPRFEGSRRQLRGEVVRRLASAGRKGSAFEIVAEGLREQELRAVLEDLVSEGLVEETVGGYRLPE